MKMDQKIVKRFLALLMVLTMIVSFVPAMASAEEIPEDATVVYLDGTVETSGDGATADTAVKTLAEAYAKLDASNPMEKNIIIVCGNTNIVFDSTTLTGGHLYLPAKAATIKAMDGQTVTLTATDDGNSPYAKMVLAADTKFDGVNLAFGTHNIMNAANKLILNVTGAASGAEGCDMEIYGGQYANVGVSAKNDTGSVVIHGGKVTARLEASAAMNNLNMTVLGGDVATMYPSGRSNNLAIGNLTVTLGGGAKVNTISGTNFDTNITNSTMLYANFTGSVGGTLPAFDKIGVAANGTDADFAKVCNLVDTIYVQDGLKLTDKAVLANASGKNIAALGDSATINLPGAEYTIPADVQFTNVTLACSDDTTNPTILYYDGTETLPTSGSVKILDSSSPTTIYLNGTSGNDENSGLTEAQAVATLQRAYALLDANKTMEENIIIVCDNVDVVLASHTYLPSIPATIKAQDGKKVVLSASTGTGTNVYTKLYFQADTQIKGVELSFNTHTIVNKDGKLILAVTGSASGIEGCDMEIYDGSYQNVGVLAKNNTGTVTIHGGSVTLRLEASAAMNNLNMTVLGGDVATMYPSGRSNNLAIGNLTVTLGGGAKVNTISSTNFDTNITNSTMLYENFTGSVGGTLPAFKKIGVAAEGNAADLTTAWTVAGKLGKTTIYVEDGLSLAESDAFSIASGKTIAALNTSAAINFTAEQYELPAVMPTFADGITLQFSDDSTKPTVLWGAAPATACEGYYVNSEQAAALAQLSLTLDGDIGVNFYLVLKQSVIDDADAYFLVTLPDGSEEQIKVSEATQAAPVNGTKAYYRLTGLVAAKEMADKVKVEVYSNNAVVATFNYSVQDYANAISSGPVQTLVAAMLNYGSATQLQLNYKTDTLANPGFASVTLADPSGLTGISGTGAMPDGLTYKEYSVITETKTTLRQYFSLDEGKKISDYTFTLNGVKVTPRFYTEKGYYYVDVDNIAAADMDVAHTLVITDGTNTFTVECSVHSYIKAVFESDAADTLKNVVKAMYAYNQAAEAYFS